MRTQTITVSFVARTGWLRFVIAVANTLSRAHLYLIAGLWLWLLQPTFIIGIHINGQYRHFGPLRWRRWSYSHTGISVNLQLTRKSHATNA